MKPVGEPDAGNRPVRFKTSEGGGSGQFFRTIALEQGLLSACDFSMRTICGFQNCRLWRIASLAFANALIEEPAFHRIARQRQSRAEVLTRDFVPPTAQLKLASSVTRFHRRACSLRLQAGRGTPLSPEQEYSLGRHSRAAYHRWHALERQRGPGPISPKGEPAFAQPIAVASSRRARRYLRISSARACIVARSKGSSITCARIFTASAMGSISVAE